MRIEQEYKGFVIGYDENSNNWLVYRSTDCDGYKSVAKSNSLINAKARCDALIKKENEFEPIRGILIKEVYSSSLPKYSFVTITAIDQMNSSKVWAIDKNDKRHKLLLCDIVALTQDNIDAIKLIKELKAKLEENRIATENLIKETQSRFTPIILPIKHEIKEAE